MYNYFIALKTYLQKSVSEDSEVKPTAKELRRFKVNPDLKFLNQSGDREGKPHLNSLHPAIYSQT